MSDSGIASPAARFEEYARPILAETPELKHTWETIGKSRRLFFPRQTQSGYDVAVEASNRRVDVIAGRVRFHLNFTPDTEAAVFEDAFARVRDMLTTNMRIRELRAGGQPYRWFLEQRQGKEWVVDEKHGLPVWNFFGAREELIFMNNSIPARWME